MVTTDGSPSRVLEKKEIAKNGGQRHPGHFDSVEKHYPSANEIDCRF